ncbi:MAG: glycosyltransferase family 9 protein [Betaproteobacteria bacterium]|nr:glycosyltransferase family 9 protein [Betaproteobacteria bacterium]
MSGAPRFLVIRRDNIGDLVCTTPLIAALRARYPEALIAALVNTYNAEVIANNPHLDCVYAYGKAKHRGESESLLRTYASRLRLVLEIRRRHFDYAILAAPGFQPRSLRLAKWVGAKHVVGFTEGVTRAERAIDLAVRYGDSVPRHEVEDVYRLLGALGIDGTPPALQVVPDPALEATMRSKLAERLPGDGPLIGIHISARKPSQRWPVERFAGLIRALDERHGARFVLLWAPGSGRNPRHPGDDEKARSLVDLVSGQRVLAVPTFRLSELIAALSTCDFVACADGGAMHLAAALGKPILCFFGDSSPGRWRPWGVRHELLQHESRDVAAIGVETAAAAFERLMGPWPIA